MLNHATLLGRLSRSGKLSISFMLTLRGATGDGAAGKIRVIVACLSTFSGFETG